MKTSRMPSSQFPAAWPWLVDEAIPEWVKKHYSPKESWKDKPFSKEDSRFFFKGIEELSEIFTQNRAKALQTYFQHPKYRSAYLLYFLPLQAAKFVTLFQLHEAALKAALAHSRKQGVLRVADLGAGPGTASIAVLLWLLHQSRDPEFEMPARIELEWFDTQKGVMDDGRGLAEMLASHFPKLRGRVQIRTHVEPWWDASKRLEQPVSLMILGHVVNEASGSHLDFMKLWSELLGKAHGGGVLVVEPAAKGPSQGLSKLRDRLFESELLPREGSSLWGPCLHAEACPLADGRDWCHFSVPVEIPGQWFRTFSKALSSERQWVKFSYLWITGEGYPAPLASPQLRRVISDPIRDGGNRDRPKDAGGTVLLCEPEQPGRYTFGRGEQPYWRGDLLDLRKIKLR